MGWVATYVVLHLDMKGVLLIGRPDRKGWGLARCVLADIMFCIICCIVPDSVFV